jgi:hypothetical protein
MRLTSIIKIIQLSYGSMVFVSLFGIGASFYFLKEETLVFTIILLLALIIVALFVKLNLINMYLKKGKYSYEFLSVLEQLDLTGDIQINWSEDLIYGPNKSELITKEFLEDNELITEIGVKKINKKLLSLFSFVVIALPIFGIFYFKKKYTFQESPSIFISLGILLITGLFFLTKNKHSQNSEEVILAFKEKGLLLNGKLYNWINIKEWKYKVGSEHRSGVMEITHSNVENEKIKANLDNIDIDKIDFMLLLTHFKAKYG